MSLKTYNTTTNEGVIKMFIDDMLLYDHETAIANQITIYTKQNEEKLSTTYTS